jgi:hypothetical protein
MQYRRHKFCFPSCLKDNMGSQNKILAKLFAVKSSIELFSANWDGDCWAPVNTGAQRTGVSASLA